MSANWQVKLYRHGVFAFIGQRKNLRDLGWNHHTVYIQKSSDGITNF